MLQLSGCCLFLRNLPSTRIDADTGSSAPEVAFSTRGPAAPHEAYRAASRRDDPRQRTSEVRLKPDATFDEIRHRRCSTRGPAAPHEAYRAAARRDDRVTECRRSG